MLPLLAAVLLATPPSLDAQHLPGLPPRGLARQMHGAVELQSLRGRPFGRLARFRLAEPQTTHGVLLARGRARYIVDILARRVRRVYPLTAGVPTGCRFGDASASAALFLCGHSLKMRAHRRTRVLVGPAGRVGHWAWGEFSPDGRHVLAEWSAECEIPVTFDLVVAEPRLVPLGAATIAAAPEAVPLGWLANGRPVVHILHGACGSGASTPGVYVFGGRRPQLLARSRGIAPLAMWGG